LSIDKSQRDGFYFTSYTGDSAVLLAFNLEDDKIDNLAGFAVKCKAPHTETYKTDEYWVKNRLNFEKPLTAKEKLTPKKWVSSNEAPFQTFHWTHFPNAGPGKYTYTTYPVYFDGGELKLVDGLSLDIDLSYRVCPDFELGFTRGYISSQAYADKFKNEPIQPKDKAIDFPTDAYEEKYVWLGAHARKILFNLLTESKEDNSITLDVFVFDFNEPDMIRVLCAMGPRVRVFMDNSASHIREKALEPKAKEKLIASSVTVKTGKFGRLAHNKVIIQKKNSTPVKVLTGSANFSIRGLYVQANSILLFDDSKIAKFYETAFEQAFSDVKEFKKSEIASRWHGAKVDNGSPVSVSFAPHRTAFSLDRVAEIMESARSSLMFAMMELSGKGRVMELLKDLGERDIYSMGTIEKRGQLAMFKPGREGQSAVTSFAYLKKSIPTIFRKEMSGGAGQVIHHKFVVCDFNDKSPMVFCGSSNFAEGGEKSNGDNLIAIQDQDAAVSYAVEAIRLYDHYKFRSQQETSTSDNPMKLANDDKWTARYFNPKDIKFKERNLLCQC
jgi:hypothetical protein